MSRALKLWQRSGSKVAVVLRNLILKTPRLWKRVFLIIFDVTALMVAIWASYALRLADWTPAITQDRVVLAILAPVVAIPVFIRMGLYRAVIRYLTEAAIWTIIKAMVISTMVWVLLIFLLEMVGQGIVPRSVPFFYLAIGTALIGGSRFLAKRILNSGTGLRRNEAPVFIYGAGQSAVQLAHALRGSGNRYVMGFIDDDPAHHGRDFAGYRVFSPKMLPTLTEQYGIKEIILSMSAIPMSRRQAVISNVSGLGVRICSLPDISDLVDGRYIVNQIREIELDELLGRSFVPPDVDLLRQVLEDRSVMVTGAGGSIGSELCRLIVHWKPTRLVLFEANEFALYKLQQELQVHSCEIIPVLGSVVDPSAVRRAIQRHQVEVVYHAAAHKHVPLVEANILEGIRNNVLGTLTVCDVAFEEGVEKFVLISSDKAVRPTNVMGATKRWAELIVRHKALQAQQSNRPQTFCAVRFGNVIGSNGSVVPLFKEQIAKGGPITLTDPDMTRYFMSIPEAAELIVQASALSQGGDIFLLDMGEPIRIGDLAKDMIRLAGFNVREANSEDGIAIEIVGRRPGEKLYEELFYDKDNAEPTQHPKILRADSSAVSHYPVAESLAHLKEELQAEDEVGAKKVLFDLISIS